MKKVLWMITSIIGLLIVLFCLVPTGKVSAAATTVASGTCGESVSWSLNSDGLLNISGSGEMADYTINDLPPWNEHSSTIKKAVIANGITSIGSSSFWKCSVLESISIPQSVTVIGRNAFYTCSSLKSVSLPKDLITLGDHAFTECAKLTSVSIPSGVKQLKESTFSSCTALVTVNLSEGLEQIGTTAFYNCSSLKRIDIPSTVYYIGTSAFNSCSNLEPVNLSEGLKQIGPNAFCNCTSLKSVTFPSTLREISNSAFYNCSSLEGELIIPEVLNIASYAFYNCSSLESVYLSDGTIYIHDYAFANCTSITKVRMPQSTSIIFKYAFSGCSSLEEITLTSQTSLKRIDEGAFNGCWSLKSIILPERLTSIGDSAFNGCSRLSDISIPDNVTVIGEDAFVNCKLLTSISIPANVETIKRRTFLQSGLTEVEFAENCKLTKIEERAFSTTPLQHIELPNSVTTMETRVFENCKSLQSVSLSSEMREIASDMFISCDNLASVFIPNGITKIGSRAFGFCKKLNSITIPPSVTALDLNCFSGPSAVNASEAITSIVLEGGSGSLTIKGFSVHNAKYHLKMYYPKDQIWEHPEADYLVWIPYTTIYTVEYKESEDDTVYFSEPASDIEPYTIRDSWYYEVKGSEYHLPVEFNGPLKAGCEFVGWSKTPNATTAQYAPGEPITVTEDTVLYAVWENITPPAEVTNLKAVPAGKGRVTLTWTASSGAEGYLVYGQKNGKYGYVGMTTQGTTFTDTKALYDDYNFYWVFPFIKDVLGNMVPRNTETYVYAKGILTAITGLKASSVTGGVKLTWNSVSGAEGYLVYGIVDGKPYGYVGMTTKGTTFTDKTASKTQYNYYWVFPYFKDGSGKMIVGQTAKYTYGRAI